MEWIVAPAVKAGDRVAIIAPASPVSVDLLEAGIAVLRSWDLVPVVHPQVWSKQGYLAGSDEERADALVGVLDDPSIAAVVCAQGGYGCTRLLELLPISRIGAHNLPSKRFFGFSDITALHSLMRVAVPGYVSFYAPMLATSYFAKSTELSRESLRLSMFAPNLQSACPPLKGRCLQMGRARSTNGVVSGRLVGGNLTVFTNCLATPWQEDMERCILILEDVHEAPYSVDRMFTHLKSVSPDQEVLKKIEALVLGDFGDALRRNYEELACANKMVTQETVEKWFWLEQMRLPPDLPVLSGLPIGHIGDNRVVPLGAFVDVNLRTCSLSVSSLVGRPSHNSRL